MLDLVFDEYSFFKESQRSFEETEPTTWAMAEVNKESLIKVLRARSLDTH